MIFLTSLQAVKPAYSSPVVHRAVHSADSFSSFRQSERPDDAEGGDRLVEQPSPCAPCQKLGGIVELVGQMRYRMVGGDRGIASAFTKIGFVLAKR
jgi:hypothetical protein